MSTAIRCRNFQLAQAYLCGQLNFQCQPNFYSSARQAENHWSWPSFDWTTIAYLNLVGMLFGTMDHLNTQQLAQQLSSWGLDSWKVVPRCHFFKIVNFFLYYSLFFFFGQFIRHSVYKTATPPIKKTRISIYPGN